MGFNNFETVKLPEIGTLSRGKSKHRPRYDPVLYGGKYPFIQTGDIRKAGKRIKDFEQSYSEVGLSQSKLWKKDTLCITIAANIAETSILDFEACFPDSVVGFIPDTSRCSIDYIYYYFQYFKKEIQSRAYGSVQENINLKVLNDIDIILPSLHIQNKITSILSPLDEKIEVNNKVIQNLEEFAQTFFKRWFVDFEFPNENGEPYKSSDGEMVESEIGLVPVEWQVGKASDIFHFSPKTTLKKGELVDYIEMKDLNDSAVIHSWKKRVFSGSGSKFINGDTLLARITPCLENGKIGYVEFMEKEEVGWGSTEFITIRSKEGYPKTLTYFFASNPDFKNYAISNMNGSSGRQRVNHQTLGNYSCVVYPIEITHKFAEIADEIMEMMSNMRNEINTLINIRETLLPKLLSGEIELSDETEVTEHVPIP
ncbi:restriction endonuclease subunit S [Paenisporosarcina macmurdoensis]|uniref:Restriction endonuclease subunit S n=1 Tax=Paenisporosarcina macmurdoensis TaxID=212659 RepID=A0ABW1LA36_9BACL